MGFLLNTYKFQPGSFLQPNTGLSALEAKVGFYIEGTGKWKSRARWWPYITESGNVYFYTRPMWVQVAISMSKCMMSLVCMRLLLVRVVLQVCMYYQWHCLFNECSWCSQESWKAFFGWEGLSFLQGSFWDLEVSNASSGICFVVVASLLFPLSLPKVQRKARVVVSWQQL